MVKLCSSMVFGSAAISWSEVAAIGPKGSVHGIGCCLCGEGIDAGEPYLACRDCGHNRCLACLPPTAHSLPSTFTMKRYCFKRCAQPLPLTLAMKRYCFKRSPAAVETNTAASSVACRSGHLCDMVVEEKAYLPQSKMTKKEFCSGRGAIPL